MLLFFFSINQFISKFFNVTIYGEAVFIENDSEYEDDKNLILSGKLSLQIQKTYKRFKNTHNIYKVVPKRLKFWILMNKT